ncbi:septal ring lytic transglycosylase RlpA family protein [Cyclobacterium qasimii]|uniref:Probable endolytic peptidoglycan transglycosylase RlpA n=2 Tax=Cyclobacterium qasimii TaxID=1350429 RepID=S7VNB7_9BACT|nr:septal ring lytic transglycosylase RlpA family protein [Cyclobacterium qasimii]EPR71486.1 Rare lipoprotein A precursor [Cyclobacterium qasimii M12-11B]
MKRILALCLLLTLGFGSATMAQSPFSSPDSLLIIQEGVASFYGTRFHKRKTANGEVYDMWEYTAAHKHLPFGTLLKVTNQQNGLEAIVRVNDRLPKSSRRIIDLSKGVAEQLEMVNDGIVEVKLSLLSEQAVEWVRAQYKKVPKDIRLRSFQPVIAFQRDEEELMKLENKAF